LLRFIAIKQHFLDSGFSILILQSVELTESLLASRSSLSALRVRELKLISTYLRSQGLHSVRLHVNKPEQVEQIIVGLQQLPEVRANIAARALQASISAQSPQAQVRYAPASSPYHATVSVSLAPSASPVPSRPNVPPPAVPLPGIPASSMSKLPASVPPKYIPSAPKVASK
jgi:hypothetical protein